MGCCGDKIKQVKNIVKGAVISLLPLPTSIMANRRMAICNECEFQTWLLVHEFVGWLKEHGIEIIDAFSNLEKLSNLPIKEERLHTSKYCARCKCPIESKSRVKDSDCIEDKWIGTTMAVNKEARQKQWVQCCSCQDNRFEDIRGVCGITKQFYPTKFEIPPRQSEVKLSSGETFIIKEMVSDCPKEKWILFN